MHKNTISAHHNTDHTVNKLFVTIGIHQSFLLAPACLCSLQVAPIDNILLRILLHLTKHIHAHLIGEGNFRGIWVRKEEKKKRRKEKGWW